mmetsp:Transcript_28475/g.41578  ORF Transcript_28475/g.41578 Transcript_28475/m.41578 type:complete len:480 (+) Transcript_28475:84-1523(+)
MDTSIGNALIVGGGPAGALAAKMLSDRKFNVTLVELYPDPSGSQEKRHAYVISINPRGARALRRVGIDPTTDLDCGVASYALIRNGTKANSAPKIKKMDEPHVFFRRQKLTAGLLEKAKEAGATIVYGEKLTDIDFDEKIATFESSETGKVTKRSYDLLVGADGVKSVTRTLLENRGLFDGPVRTIEDDMQYQVAVLPHWKELLCSEASVDAPDTSFQSYADRSSNTNSLSFPLPDGKTLVTFIAPSGFLDKLKKEGVESYKPALETHFSNWSDEARLELATQLAAEDNVPTNGGLCVWTPALGAPKKGVVLVGDSGHGMWPSLGQGCNAALESVSVLADAVEAVCGTDYVIPSAGAGVRKEDIWEMTSGERSCLVAEEYQGLRYDDAKAIVDLTFNGIGGRRVRGQQNGTVMFLFKLSLMTILNKVTLSIVPKPFLLRMQFGDDVPYSTLLWQGKCETMLAYFVLLAIPAFFALIMFK